MVSNRLAPLWDRAAKMRRKSGKRSLLVFLLLSAMAACLLLKPSSDSPAASVGRWESAACACATCLRGGDPFFSALIDGAPEAFLSRDMTSAADFKWWQGLQSEKRDFAFYNATLGSLFQIIPPFPEVGGARRGSCRSCAVVGNSGRLKGSFYGPLIDHHDIVIRMNRGRTKGFERDVGTKTTHHVFYPESAITLDNTTHLLFASFKLSDLLWLQRKLNPHDGSAKDAKRIANKDLVMVLNPAFMRYVHESWLEKKGRYPSTGFLAFALSLQMCDEVDVFGFGADEDGNWNHYYESFVHKRLRTGPHPGTKEYDLIQLLGKSNKIQFF